MLSEILKKMLSSDLGVESVWREQLSDRHLVLRQSSRFIRADHVTAAWREKQRYQEVTEKTTFNNNNNNNNLNWYSAFHNLKVALQRNIQGQDIKHKT